MNMKQKVKISSIKSNPNNPRIMRDFKFKKLVKSIEDFPEMLEKRPIVVDEDMMILGGNMRWRACKDAGLKEVWIDIAEGWTEKQKEEFVIKDNVNFGEWDYDILANNYNVVDLDTMGVELNPTMFGEVEDNSNEEARNVVFNDYTIYFANEKELDIWYSFMKKLKNKWEEYDNISPRVLRYIAEVYEENGMKESEMILRFIEDGE